MRSTRRRSFGWPPISSSREPTTTESWSRIDRCEPELVLLAPCGYPLDKTKREWEGLRGREGFSRLAERCPVWGIDGNAYFNRPGPRLVDSAEIVAEILKSGRELPGVAERLA